MRDAAQPSVNPAGGPAARMEAEYRRNILSDIGRRVADNGPHRARAHEGRARQFMPFAALKGYGELAHAKEFKPEPLHTPTEEESAELSATVSRLKKGDAVRVVRYRNGAYRELVGAVSDIEPALKTIRVMKEDIPFRIIRSIAPIDARDNR